MKFAVLAKAARESLEHPGRAKPLPKRELAGYSHLYLCRHTQTYDNVRRIFSGRRNSHLTPQGEKQARYLAKLLKNKRFDLFIISPLDRCRETIAPLKSYHKQVPVREEPLLLERDYGRLTGTSKMKLMRTTPKLAILYRRSYNTPPPHGESLKTVKEKRVFPFCRQLFGKMKQQQTNILICCTNNTMRLIRMFFEKLSVEKMLTLENPFGDYASYSIAVKKPNRQ